MEDMMKNCNRCRFFEKGCCTKGSFEIDLDNNIDKIIEDGLIEEAIREGFSEKVFNSINKKKLTDFIEEFEDAKNNWIEEISQQIEMMLRNNLSTEYAVMLKDSRYFYCSQWD